MTDVYLSIADFAEYRGVTPTSSTSPSLVQVTQYIDNAEIQFEKKVGKYSTETDKTSVVKCDSKGLYVDEGHITSITSISVSNGDIITPTFTTIESTDYKLHDAEFGRILLRNPIVGREYQVIYDYGYDLVDVPITIKEIVYLMTMDRVFKLHLFENNLAGDVTRTIDVDVYKEVTKGGDAFEGFGAMELMIAQATSNFKGTMRTRLGW